MYIKLHNNYFTWIGLVNFTGSQEKYISPPPSGSMPRFLISMLASVANNNILCKMGNAPVLNASTEGSFLNLKKKNAIILKML